MERNIVEPVQFPAARGYHRNREDAAEKPEQAFGAERHVFGEEAERHSRKRDVAVGQELILRR